MKKLSSCPVCGGKLVILEYACRDCGVTIKGEFSSESFLNLSDEYMDFLYRYLSLRGNLRELGNRMGISYPTVRGKFDELLTALGIRPDPGAREEKEVKSEIAEILEKMDSGEMSSKEGIDLIKKLKRR